MIIMSSMRLSGSVMPKRLIFIYKPQDLLLLLNKNIMFEIKYIGRVLMFP
jgi:hypothetical protein